jgi:hypothetical protein
MVSEHVVYSRFGCKATAARQRMSMGRGPRCQALPQNRQSWGSFSLWLMSSKMGQPPWLFEHNEFTRQSGADNGYLISPSMSSTDDEILGRIAI